MGLLDAFEDSTGQALDVMAARPPETPAAIRQPKYSAWSAVPRGIAAAAVELVGNAADVVSLYGETAAAMGTNRLATVPQDAAERKQMLDAFDKLQTHGLDTRPEESRPYYEAGKDLRPDPMTAGYAENILFGLSKGLTKAVGAGAVLGPLAGAGVFGASEGMTTAEDLADQGVDQITRMKAGAVVGAVNAAYMALPIAGNTLAQTAGLVALGGPGAFMAQQAATRAILEDADYGRIAQQFDPLDPVGLTLATLVPAGFATAMKVGARGARALPQDDLDAAMVHNLTAVRDAHDATGPGPAMARETDATFPAMEPQATTTKASDTTPGEQVDDLTNAAYARVEQLVAENPDMPVGIREDGTPIRLADEIEAIRRTAREGTEDTLGADDANLLQVAAACALSIGAA